MSSARHWGVLIALTLSGALLSGCEREQTNAQGIKQDAAPWSGTSTGASSDQRSAGTAFTAGGWTVGDKGSWEQQLKTRALNGQNEYSRTH